MTTSPISAVLPSSSPSTGVRRGGEGPESPVRGNSFSSVLARQHGSDPAKPASGAVDEGGPKGGKAARQAKDEQAAIVEAMTEQALNLPQLALNIAAEVAAVQRPAVRVDGLPSADGPAVVVPIGANRDGTRRQRNTRRAKCRRHACSLFKVAKALLNPAAPDTQPGTDALPKRALPQGFVPVLPSGSLEAAARPPALAAELPGQTAGTAVAPARAASIAGAKQAVLAMQARARRRLRLAMAQRCRSS